VEERGLFASVGDGLPLSWPSWPVMSEGERERESVALIRGVVGGFDFLGEFGFLEKDKSLWLEGEEMMKKERKEFKEDDDIILGLK